MVNDAEQQNIQRLPALIFVKLKFRSLQISGRIPGVDEILKLAEYFNNFFFRMILPQRKLGQDLL